MGVLIDLNKVYEFIKDSGRFSKGEKATAYHKILNVFNYGDENRVTDRRQDLYYLARSGAQRILNDQHWDDFCKALSINPIQDRKFLRYFVPEGIQIEEIPPANALLGEIEILSRNDNLLSESIHGVPARLVEVYVNDVKFLHYVDKTGHEIVVREGKYISIEPPPKISGGVALGVDKESGDVLLVSQFRHSPHRFLTEAPRGFFALGDDELPADAAVRELREETGFYPISEPIVLKESYTDSGLLSFRPVLCLMFVDKNKRVSEPKLDAAMVVPIWVKLEKFYEAVYKDNGTTKLETGDFEEIKYFEDRDTSDWALPHNLGQLEICDNFTLVAATLAQPYLIPKYPKLRHFVESRNSHRGVSTSKA